MVLILDGHSEHVAHACRKIGLSGKKFNTIGYKKPPPTTKNGTVSSIISSNRIRFSKYCRIRSEHQDQNPFGNLTFLAGFIDQSDKTLLKCELYLLLCLNKQ